MHCLTFSDPSLMDCGAPLVPQCGSEKWLFTNSTLLQFVKGTCQNGDQFSSYSAAASCFCPAAADISPCTCGFTDRSETTITIDCTDKSLDDVAMARIVNKIQTWSPVDTMLLNGNRLKVVPPGLPLITRLVDLNLASNQITSVGSTELQLPAKVTTINLSSNNITALADNCFPGSSSYQNDFNDLFD